VFAEDEEGAFDFEEAVFGAVDKPDPQGGLDHGDGTRRARRSQRPRRRGPRRKSVRRPPQAVQVLRRTKTIKIDYKDAGLLKYFITDRGKLVPPHLGHCASTARDSTA